MAISLMASILDSRKKWSHNDHGFDPKTTVDYISGTLVLLQGFKSKKGKAKKAFMYLETTSNVDCQAEF
jgi:hypothetical protein